MARIFYVITKANWGGAQRYVFDLAAAAEAAGHTVAVVTEETGILAEKLAAAHIRTIPLSLRQQRTFIGDLLTFGSLFSLVRIMRRERPDVVHVNSAKAGGLGAFAARLTGVPRIIFTAHGWEFNAPRNWLSRLGIRFFSWLTVLLAHRTIAVSEAIRRDTRRWPGTGGKIVVIHNGITCPAFLPREEARARLSPHGVGRYWIGMLSELNTTKRVEDAIRAFSLLTPKHPDTILVVLGEGRERAKLEDLVRELQLTKQVSLPGFRADAPTLLPAFDLFLHSSQTEALGYAVLEAGCASLPVVAANVGGIPEIIPDSDHGLLVEPRDPTALAEAMEALLSDRRRAAELGARLKARISQAFSKDRMLLTTLSLYDR